MAVWSQNHGAERSDRAASGDRPDAVERLVSGASILGLAAIALVVVLAWLLLASGPYFGHPDLGRLDAAPSYAPDEMARQRVADIAAERRLAEARATAPSRPDIIDAHVSSFQARAAR